MINIKQDKSIGYQFSIEKGGPGSGIRGHTTIKPIDNKPKNQFNNIPGYEKVSKIFGSNLHIEDENSEQVKSDIKDISLFSSNTLTNLAKLGMVIYIGDKPYPMLDTHQHLINKVPRGWINATWMSVGSAFDEVKNELTLGKNINGRFSANVPGHEMGHAIQKNLLNTKQQGQLIDIHKKYYHEMNSTYYQQGEPGGKAGVSEMFAESLATNYVKDHAKFKWDTPIYQFNKNEGFRKEMNNFIKENVEI